MRDWRTMVETEKPSTNLPDPSGHTPHRWADGTVGEQMDIGPYGVCVRPDWVGKDLGHGYAMIQICRLDGGSVVDWRHLQQIKNRVVGKEWYAVEIFPPESLLKDPSNARYLWCCAGKLPFGLPGGRMILDAHESIAPQRPFASGHDE